MRAMILAAVILSAAGPVAAQAVDAAATAATAPAAVKVGATIRTADGRRIGRIDRLEMRGGQQVASLIYQSRIVRIPVSTLTADDKGLVTTLAKDDIK